jgi:uncharacterized membrane protein affecting hemolysin expression
MQRDMIGLQAHLSRLLKTPGIVSAVIYDARNELMAQAGATPSELSNRDYLHNYSATLALGDNMTGSVVVTLDTKEIEHLLPEVRWVLCAVSVLVLFLLVIVSRYFARDINQQRSALAQTLNDFFPALLGKLKLDNMHEEDIRLVLGQLREHVDRVQAPSPAALRDAAADLLNSGGGRVYLLLECHNLDLLQRQVSRDRLRALLDQMQQQVEKTCRLYNAQRMPAAGSCIKMVMAADEGRITEVLLQAACCAECLQVFWNIVATRNWESSCNGVWHWIGMRRATTIFFAIDNRRWMNSAASGCAVRWAVGSWPLAQMPVRYCKTRTNSRWLLIMGKAASRIIVLQVLCKPNACCWTGR